ncbi:hypothetical protein BDV11DRAFT_193603 [Aspergillus similis]
MTRSVGSVGNESLMAGAELYNSLFPLLFHLLSIKSKNFSAIFTQSLNINSKNFSTILIASQPPDIYKMRFLVPLALLGATATTVVAETPQDLLQDSIPQCMQSCFSNVAEKVSGCDLSDTDCFCKASTTDSDAISTAEDDLTSCVKNSNCTASETQQIADLDVNSLLSKANDLCSKFPRHLNGKSAS